MPADTPQAFPLTDAALSRSAAAHEKHPLLLVLARAVWSGASAEHKAMIEAAMGDHGRGKEFFEPPKPAPAKTGDDKSWYQPKPAAANRQEDDARAEVLVAESDANDKAAQKAKAKAEADRRAALAQT